ncbi:MAG: CapA family protein [Alphaproteobacteria bacterium]|jgi:poly-gamma-glutamate synthesis protein (capsule biosynthesis protein)|nr:CapA family protein [Alphaproteobacteria bacterium]
MAALVAKVSRQPKRPGTQSTSADVGLVLCGDVMLGRGIDQLLPHPGDPSIPVNRRGITSARGYVDLAERKHGPAPDDRAAEYVWGDALAVFDSSNPDLRLINLETAITARGRPWPRKGIHYRMHPRNADVLTRARIDFCSLANNHVLDWGYPGLEDTIDTLDRAGIAHAGAGRNREQAGAPAVLSLPDGGRVIVVSLATPSSGVASLWAASRQRPGVNLVRLTERWLAYVQRRITAVKRAGDVAVASIHWGPNWGHEFEKNQRAFARRLIDDAGVDLVHGHSSHHVRGIEAYNGKLILYGCGDLINDYEGIPKTPEQEPFAPDLGLIYFARLSATDGRLVELRMQPTGMCRLKVRRADDNDAGRLEEILNREGARLGTRVVNDNGCLRLQMSDC